MLCTLCACVDSGAAPNTGTLTAAVQCPQPTTRSSKSHPAVHIGPFRPTSTVHGCSSTKAQVIEGCRRAPRCRWAVQMSNEAHIDEVASTPLGTTCPAICQGCDTHLSLTRHPCMKRRKLAQAPTGQDARWTHGGRRETLGSNTIQALPGQLQRSRSSNALQLQELAAHALRLYSNVRAHPHWATTYHDPKLPYTKAKSSPSQRMAQAMTSSLGNAIVPPL